MELLDSHLDVFLPLFKSLTPCKLYGKASTLFYEDFSEFLPEEGSQQGCPLGGLLFILSVASIAEDVATRFPSVTVLAFADDYAALPKKQGASAAFAAQATEQRTEWARRE